MFKSGLPDRYPVRLEKFKIVRTTRPHTISLNEIKLCLAVTYTGQLFLSQMQEVFMLLLPEYPKHF